MMNDLSRRRITIHNYPEHLNPFHDNYDQITTDIRQNNNIKESNANNNNRSTKYGTWGSTSRSKIQHSILQSNWIDALNLTPAKKKVGKKWSLFKTSAVVKFQRARSKSNAFEHTLQRPERKYERKESPINIRPNKPFSDRLMFATSTPIKPEKSAWTKEVKQEENEIKTSFEDVKPKMRKKRAAPRPPTIILSPESQDMSDEIKDCSSVTATAEAFDSTNDNEIDVDYSFTGEIQVYNHQYSGDNDDDNILQLQPDCQDQNNDSNNHKENSYNKRSSKDNILHIEPLIDQPNIATLISNNLTL